MATRAENIEARLDAIAEELASLGPTVTLGTQRAGGLPDAPGNVEHVAYRMSLVLEQEKLLAALSKLQGAFEVTSEMTA